MPKGNSQAEALKRKSADQKEVAIQRAIELYESLARANPEKPPGYRTVCKMVEDELEGETGVKLKLCYNTVRARSNGTLGPTTDDGALMVSFRPSFPHPIQSGKDVAAPRRRGCHT